MGGSRAVFDHLRYYHTTSHQKIAQRAILGPLRGSLWRGLPPLCTWLDFSSGWGPLRKRKNRTLVRRETGKEGFVPPVGPFPGMGAAWDRDTVLWVHVGGNVAWRLRSWDAACPSLM